MVRSPFFQGHKTECIRGHEFTPDNIILDKDNHRSCKKCMQDWKSEYLRELREKTKLKTKTKKKYCINGHERVETNLLKNNACRLCSESRAKKISALLGATRPKNFCINGHEYTPENTRVNTKGFRICRACHKKTANIPVSKDRTRCKNGHEYTQENIYLNPRGIRECNICRRARDNKRIKKIKALKRKLS